MKGDTQSVSASLAAPQSLTEARACLTLIPKGDVPESPDRVARGHFIVDALWCSAPRCANLTGALAATLLISDLTLPERPE